MEWKRTRELHLEVTFEVTAQHYRDLERVLRILVPGLKVVGSSAHSGWRHPGGAARRRTAPNRGPCHSVGGFMMCCDEVKL